jgi:hypothetical protein
MESISARFANRSEYSASATPLVRVIDRWFYVILATLFIIIVLVGFIPDSIGKVAAVSSGRRPPFPAILHIHAVLMASFLVLLLTQAVLAATGRQQGHRSLGVAAFALVPMVVIAGFVLVPTTYHSLVGALRAAPPPAQANIRQLILNFDNIMLLQTRAGTLFAVFAVISLGVRKTDSGLHKRLMFLAIAPALAASFTRMTWLPTTMPHSSLSLDMYILLAILPMFAWDLVRKGRIHKAYVVWMIGYVALSIPLYLLWNSAWWHSIAPHLVGL